MAQQIIKTQQFDRPYLEQLFKETDEMRKNAQRLSTGEPFRKHLMFTIFYEPSTRTRMSFESAAHHLGIRVSGTDNAGEFSSAAKGETLEDSIRVLCSYRPSVIVLRHKEEGSAEKAAEICEQFGVSLINAGDGTGQHPTQSLLDLYSIRRECGKIDGLSIVIGGDLKHGRTVRSLAYLLAKFSDVKITFVSHPDFAMETDVRAHLCDHGVAYAETDCLSDALPGADAVYWTRTQRERMSEELAKSADEIEARFTIGTREMSVLPAHARVFHPLPRKKEISKEVDTDPRAAYFRQAENGLFVRMALLAHLLEG